MINCLFKENVRTRSWLNQEHTDGCLLQGGIIFFSAHPLTHYLFYDLQLHTIKMYKRTTLTGSLKGNNGLFLKSVKRYA